MSSHRFRLLNVFAESPLSGNALCVFEDGSDLSDESMQALALQFNLSETSFLLPSKVATARVRIFAPTFEMPFAGHPTLGTAHVVRALGGATDSLTLEMKVGVISVTARGDRFTLEANAPKTRAVEASPVELATMLGVEPEQVREGPLWVDTGSEQLLVRLLDPAAVRRCRPDARLLAQYGNDPRRPAMVYVWARDDAPPVEGRDRVVARFFFPKQGALGEDPGTGSACANLGGWFLAMGHELPLAITVDQGELVGRRCRLGLDVSESGVIRVTGRVVEIGRGEITL